MGVFALLSHMHFLSGSSIFVLWGRHVKVQDYCVQIATLSNLVCSGEPLNWWSQAISYQIKWCHISEDTDLPSQSPYLYYWRKNDKAMFLQQGMRVLPQNFMKMAKINLKLCHNAFLSLIHDIYRWWTDSVLNHEALWPYYDGTLIKIYS